MSFYDYEGPEHLGRFLRWLRKADKPDYLPSDALARLSELILDRDAAVLSLVEVTVPDDALEGMACNNAQDFLLQRAYAVPDRMVPRRVLDLGAGHGRMANLAFGAPESRVEQMVVVDGIPAPYLTQRLYYDALGLFMVDYIDHDGSADDAAATVSAALADGTAIVHLPTWRFDLIPDATLDLAVAVQVLRELPRQLGIELIGQIARVLKPGGAFYVRDHQQFHHPNHLPVDALLAAAGLILEFQPQVRDRVDIHGLPRIWRKLDPANFLHVDEQAAAGSE